MKGEEKYKGSLKLAAIGDALGWMTEFRNCIISINKKPETNSITSFHNWNKIVGGRFHPYVDEIKKGSYSDDTQLLLSVARSIKPNGSVDQEYFAAKELPDWLLYSRGAGRTIKNAAQRLSKIKSAKWNENFFTFKVGKITIDYRECGANGAAMRILPIALANFGEWDKIKKEIFKNSIITHGHPRAILGAMLYGYAINTILSTNPDNFNYKDFLTELGKDMQQKFSIDFLNDSIFESWENKWNEKPTKAFRTLFESICSETHKHLQTVYKSITNNASDLDVLKKLGCYEKKTKGSGTSTVIAGVYFACKYSKEPSKGIEKAVNSIGTDTDSIAAFTGGLIGALHGESIIPQKWKQVQDYNYIDKISKRLLEIHENRAEEIIKPAEIEGIKSISEIEDSTSKIDEKVFLETLGEGKIKSISRQIRLTDDKYKLILDVEFKVGQYCRFVKRLSIEKEVKQNY